jgi:hypothetical protein
VRRVRQLLGDQEGWVRVLQCLRGGGGLRVM